MIPCQTRLGGGGGVQHKHKEAPKKELNIHTCAKTLGKEDKGGFNSKN